MRILSRFLAMISLIAILISSGCAQKQEEKVYRIGILSGLDFLSDTVEGFRAEMTELGYIEGNNIIYDIQRTNFNPDEEKSILKKFTTDDVDLIFTFPTEVSLEAKAVAKGTGIPVLFANAFIEGFDLVHSVREPGDNITGVRYPSPDIAIKSLETLLEVAPQAKRIWLPYLKGYPTVPSQLEVLHPAAARYGITLVEAPVNNTSDIEADLEARSKLADPGIDAIMHIAEPVATWSDTIAVISKFVVEHKMAYHGTGGKCVFILTIDPVQVGRQSAALADKILKGTPAGSIPVVSADPVLTINYKVAQELDLSINEGLLARAERIIR